MALFHAVCLSGAQGPHRGAEPGHKPSGLLPGLLTLHMADQAEHDALFIDRLLGESRRQLALSENVKPLQAAGPHFMSYVRTYR